MAENKGKNDANKAPETEDDDNFITLEFDDGEVACEILGVFTVEGIKDKEYIALLPDDGTDDVYLYGYKEIGEEEFEITDILSDEEFEKVSKEFEKITMEEIIDTEE